jgi:uncharacterized protein YdeI (YjbR/CyaY-like superfamily)
VIELELKNRAAWRRWLGKNHSSVREVWVVFYKKHTGKEGLTYDELVEEALCFGWIDSIIKRLDDDRYARKVTPRTNLAKWSATNLRRVRQLTDDGRMTSVGLAKIPSDVEALPAVSSRPLEVPSFMADALAQHPVAQAFFESLAPSYRRNFIHWISSAKREETRARRLAEAIALLSEEKKLGMK